MSINLAGLGGAELVAVRGAAADAAFQHDVARLLHP